jgi:hypothetical protein
VRASLEQEKLTHEMLLAHDLQMKLLPPAGALLPDATCAARVAPAESVGGDFYNLFHLGPGQVGVMIGDVSSHGYRAVNRGARDERRRDPCADDRRPGRDCAGASRPSRRSCARPRCSSVLPW